MDLMAMGNAVDVSSADSPDISSGCRPGMARIEYFTHVTPELSPSA